MFQVRHRLAGQHLQRDWSVKMDVARLVHGAHPAFTDLFDDLVVTDRSADQGAPLPRYSINSAVFPEAKVGRLIGSVGRSETRPRRVGRGRDARISSPTGSPVRPTLVRGRPDAIFLARAGQRADARSAGGSGCGLDDIETASQPVTMRVYFVSEPADAALRIEIPGVDFVFLHDPPARRLHGEFHVDENDDDVVAREERLRLKSMKIEKDM